MRHGKYNAKPCVIDGIRFDSGIEGRRYHELKLMERAGAIRDLKIHPRYELCAYPDGDLVGHYEADYEYRSVTEPGVAGRLVTEDCKGVITPLAKWKLKHFERQYGRQVQIVKKAGRA